MITNSARRRGKRQYSRTVCVFEERPMNRTLENFVNINVYVHPLTRKLLDCQVSSNSEKRKNCLGIF
jgi:hypothetical protein